MKPAVKTALVLVLILAVMVYTVYNYATGKSEPGFFFIAMGMMGFFFISMLNQLIQELKK